METPPDGTGAGRAAGAGGPVPALGPERGLRYYPDAGVAPIEVRDPLEYEPFSRFFTPGSRVVVGRAEDADVYGTRDVPSVHVKGRWATCWVAGVEA